MVYKSLCDKHNILYQVSEHGRIQWGGDIAAARSVMLLKRLPESFHPDDPGCTCLVNATLALVQCRNLRAKVKRVSANWEGRRYHEHNRSMVSRAESWLHKQYIYCPNAVETCTATAVDMARTYRLYKKYWEGMYLDPPHSIDLWIPAKVTNVSLAFIHVESVNNGTYTHPTGRMYRRSRLVYLSDTQARDRIMGMYAQLRAIYKHLRCEHFPGIRVGMGPCWVQEDAHDHETCNWANPGRHARDPVHWHGGPRKSGVPPRTLYLCGS